LSLRERLLSGRDALTAEVLRSCSDGRPEAVSVVLEMLRDAELLQAPPPAGWGPIHAVRLVGELGIEEAVSDVLRILESADEDGYLASQAVASLALMGLGTGPPLTAFLRASRPSLGRDLAIEVVDRIAIEHHGAPELDPARLVLERFLDDASAPGERGMLAAVLGDVGNVASVPIMLRALSRPDLTPRDYEAIRDAVERLDGTCPDVYFTPGGKGYPLDEEKNPACPACGVSMIIREFGELEHPPGACAATSPDGGGEPDLHR